MLGNWTKLKGSKPCRHFKYKHDDEQHCFTTIRICQVVHHVLHFHFYITLFEEETSAPPTTLLLLSSTLSTPQTEPSIITNQLFISFSYNCIIIISCLFRYCNQFSYFLYRTSNRSRHRRHRKSA